MSADELKVMPKGTFVIMETGVDPMVSKMYFYFELGIEFEEEYEVEEKAQREVLYAGKSEVEENIIKKYGSKEDDYVMKIKKMLNEKNI